MGTVKEQEIQLKIQMDEKVAAGQYVNMVVVNHNDSEFVVDCIYVQPQAPEARVHSRIITSPRHAKRLLIALQKNVDAYEKAHGVIELPDNNAEPEGSLPVH